VREKYPHLAAIADAWRPYGKIAWIQDAETGREWGSKTDVEGVQPIFDPLSWDRVKANPKLGKGGL
jgi:hypothetical protein